MAIPIILTQQQGAEIIFELRGGRAAARVAVTPAGLLAIGAMVAAILLGSATIVRAGLARDEGR